MPKHKQITSPSVGLMLAVLVAVTSMSGCNSLPFQHKERTSIITPSMRIAAIRESGARLADADPQEQQQLVEDLALQIRTEHDPLVRLAIQESIGEFQVSLARDMVVAGTQDDDVEVRRACCRLLGQRGEIENVAILRGVLQKDGSLDVKLAATDALGQINSTESIGTLALALQSRDPALQYAGVESLKQLSDEDLGNDVGAWLSFAQQGQSSVATSNRVSPASSTTSAPQTASLPTGSSGASASYLQ